MNTVFAEPQKILMVRLSALGDVLQTLPILSLLRQQYPHAHIAWMIDEELSAIIHGHPHLDVYYAVPRRRWTKALGHPTLWLQTIIEIKQFFYQIHQQQYNVGIDLQGLFKSALLLWATQIKRRIGYSHGREGSSWLYTECYSPYQNQYFSPNYHHVMHMKQLIQPLGCDITQTPIVLPPAPEHLKQKYQKLLAPMLQDDTKLVVLAPATQWQSKYWPIQHWQTLIKLILQTTTHAVVLVGTAKDSTYIRQILEPLSRELRTERVLNLAGQTNIIELRSLFDFADVVIGCDSAPVHLAAAAQVKSVIALFGPTPKLRTSPLGRSSIHVLSAEGSLDCQPCNKTICPLGTTYCMQQITPQAVVQMLYFKM